MSNEVGHEMQACIETQQFAAGSTFREFDARFLKENWNLFLAGCAIGQMIVIFILVWNIIHCADICIQTRIFLILFQRVWVVNPEKQSDEWVVYFKSRVVNYTWYSIYIWHNIQTYIILELSNLEIQIRCHFQVTSGRPVNY